MSDSYHYDAAQEYNREAYGADLLTAETEWTAEDEAEFRTKNAMPEFDDHGIDGLEPHNATCRGMYDEAKACTVPGCICPELGGDEDWCEWHWLASK